MGLPVIAHRTALDIAVDVNNDVRTRTVPNVAAGDAVLVVVSSYNYQEGVDGNPAGVVAGVADAAGNSYTKIADIESGAESHGFIGMWLAQNVGEAASLQVQLSLSINNGFNRLTWQALRLTNVPANCLGRFAVGTESTNAQDLQIALLQTSTPDQRVFAAISALWSGVPYFEFPAGYALQDENTPSDGLTMRYQLISKALPAQAAETVDWSVVDAGGNPNPQQFGLYGIALTIKGKSDRYQVRVRPDADAVSAGSIKAAVCAVGTGGQLFGAKLFDVLDESHALISTAVDVDGTAPIDLLVPESVSVALGQSVRVVAQANNPGAGGSVYGSNVLAGEVQLASTALLEQASETGSGASSGSFALTVSNGGLLDSNGDRIRLVGLNAEGPLRYHVDYYYQQGNARGGFDRVGEYSSSPARIQYFKTLFDGFNVLRWCYSPDVFKKAGGAWLYPDQIARIEAACDAAEQLGIWVLFCPYGMGSYGDIVSRARKHQAAFTDGEGVNWPAGNPNLANDAQDVSTVTLSAGVGQVIKSANADAIRWHVTNNTGFDVFVKKGAGAAAGDYDVVVPGGQTYKSPINDFAGDLSAWSSPGGSVTVEYILQPAEDPTQDEKNATAMTAELIAAIDAFLDWAGDRPNVLLQTVNEPRQMSDATWKAQQQALINHVRASSYGTKPLFIPGVNWQFKLPLAEAQELFASDDQLVFLAHQYYNQGNWFDPNADPQYWPDHKAPAPGFASDAALCTGLSEWGAAHFGFNLGKPLDIFSEWATTLLDAWHAWNGCPVQIYWEFMWDGNTLTASEDGLDWTNGNYGVTEGTQDPPFLNNWAKTVVVPCQNKGSGSEDLADAVIRDMKLPNEITLQGADPTKGWAQGPVIAMGKANIGTATPDGSLQYGYWSPADQALLGDVLRWNRFAPWWVLYRGEGDDPTANVRVLVRSLRFAIQRQSDLSWIILGSTNQVAGANYDAAVDGSSGAADVRVTTAGLREFKMPAAPENNVHGWGINDIQTGSKFAYALDDYLADIANVLVSAQVQTVLDDPNGPDDRHLSKILFAPGGDFYPYGRAEISDFAPETYNPGAGGGRYALVTPELKWRHFSAINTGFTGGEVAALPLSARTVTEAAFRASAPEF